jgi:hypothetical protein
MPRIPEAVERRLNAVRSGDSGGRAGVRAVVM